jgi:hypothetical protein
VSTAAHPCHIAVAAGVPAGHSVFFSEFDTHWCQLFVHPTRLHRILPIQANPRTDSQVWLSPTTQKNPARSLIRKRPSGRNSGRSAPSQAPVLVTFVIRTTGFEPAAPASRMQRHPNRMKDLSEKPNDFSPNRSPLIFLGPF